MAYTADPDQTVRDYFWIYNVCNDLYMYSLGSIDLFCSKNETDLKTVFYLDELDHS